ncbi:3',5'-cyclic-nucleotide phosphodiesterase [Scheffersomyces spartinae]|uniref:Phosphodiesterase n=1 Tax=Scheffersomyces spartinae TaxID=45513 RepID=A0A9P7V6E4_9ASCO|nr:3',5'-cyclic-nucleotide phosphodiesterase [Scheffersomyces spartinae]KAG7192234.1 3',5'-cyclic-nucleotide phosphodiesterase [Scheffersomyces spartinae]
MAEVLVLTYSGQVSIPTSLEVASVERFSSFNDILTVLFKRGNIETEINHATVVVLDDGKPSSSSLSKLDGLSFEDKQIILTQFFSHIHPIILALSLLEEQAKNVNKAIKVIDAFIGQRIVRVESWTGTGKKNIDDYSETTIPSSVPVLLNEFPLDSTVNTMQSILSRSTGTSPFKLGHLQLLFLILVEEIDFLSLLSNTSQAHLAKLCHLVGHWSFPANELSNDDLVYCAYLILHYALQFQNTTNTDLHIPTKNELLCLLFLVRDCYRCGSPFHNFRHAVDVLQACFHYVVRLDCLPIFKQFEVNVKLDECGFLNSTRRTYDVVELAALPIKISYKYLTPIELLGLLVAALGHDVGHPGVTNAFMIKYNSPICQIYNGRSVLENYHTAVFTSKILSVGWPSILNQKTDEDNETIKNLIISSILATDMAEHFEYIDRLNKFDYANSNHPQRAKLILALLIKCADISNVTRPLRVSSQWAVTLSREFDEIAKLEERISSSSTPANEHEEVRYNKVPLKLEDILDANPMIHKGQIFFINTFAEKLFNNVVKLLPELQYTCNIISENKEFWLARD